MASTVYLQNPEKMQIRDKSSVKKSSLCHIHNRAVTVSKNKKTIANSGYDPTRRQNMTAVATLSFCSLLLRKVLLQFQVTMYERQTRGMEYLGVNFVYT